MWPAWDQHTAKGCTGSGRLRKESKAMAFHLSASTLGNHRCHLCWLGLNPTLTQKAVSFSRAGTMSWSLL